MGKLAVIVQGSSSNIEEQKIAWLDFKNNLIFSTWKGQEHLYNIDDKVVYSNIPDDVGPMNFNLQTLSTYNGLLKAKELGYTHALKIRGDMVPTNAKEFLSILADDKINFLGWCCHEVYPRCDGYLFDPIMSGRIDDMIKLWEKFQIFCVVPEVILTKRCIDLFPPEDINFFLDGVTPTNNIYWIKRNVYLDTFKTMLPGKENRNLFSTDKKYMNNEYINRMEM